MCKHIALWTTEVNELSNIADVFKRDKVHKDDIIKAGENALVILYNMIVGVLFL